MKTKTPQFRLTSGLKNFKFDLKRGKGHLFSYFINRIRWHLLPRLHHVSKFPSHVDVELSSLCNLNCPMCYTTTEKFKTKVNGGNMTFDLYKKIIDECAKYNLYSIRLSLRGESFLNKNIYDMIKYAKEKGIKEVSCLTHGGFLDEEKFEKLIDLELDWLTISFDGIGETYNKIRYPLKYEDSVEKIKHYQEIKNKRNVVKPVIKVQTVWPAISENPKEFYDTFEPITDQIAANPLLDYLENDTNIEFEENFTCPQLWERLVIGANGHVMLCANDGWEEYPLGDVNNESLFDVCHGKILTKAREIQIKHSGTKEIQPCKHCYMPRKMESSTSKLGDRFIKIDKYTNREQTVGK